MEDKREDKNMVNSGFINPSEVTEEGKKEQEALTSLSEGYLRVLSESFTSTGIFAKNTSVDEYGMREYRNENSNCTFTTPFVFGIVTFKLLWCLLDKFTRQNDIKSNPEDLNREVTISLSEYLKFCNFNISTKEQLKAYRKKYVTEQLQILSSTKFTTNEIIHGEEQDRADNIPIIISNDNTPRSSINEDTISVVISMGYAKLLFRRPRMNYYPILALGLDNRNKLANEIIVLFSEHYSMQNNHKRGTANEISVASLLKDLPDLPDINSTSVKVNGWRKRIREPLEKALNDLLFDNPKLLSDWYYCKNKGEKFTDEEISEDFTTFYKWQNTLIYFELVDPPEIKIYTPLKKKKSKGKNKSIAS